MKKDIYQYLSYKAYLNDHIDSKPGHGRGLRSKLAEALNCQTSHISQVLSGESHFNFEQADLVSEFLGHTKDEARFFLLLVHHERAGTPSLKNKIREQIQETQSKRLVLKDRVDVKTVLSKEDQATYYSSWHYAVVHVMLTIEAFQNKDRLAKRLGLSTRRISEILEFLESIGLAKQEAGKYKVGEARIFLGSDSPMITKHHTNWRMQAIQSLDREDFRDDLHYSSAVTVSLKDAFHIKSVLIKHIEEIKAAVRDSGAEEGYCFALDFFKI